MGIESAILLSALNSGAISVGTAAAISSTTTAIGSVLGGLSAVSSLVGGIQGMQEGKSQARAAEQQAAMQGAEAERQAQREARFEQQNVDSMMRRQKLAYLKSGVTLEGSPLLVMEETRRKGAENIDEILQGGAYAKSAAATEGRVKAQALKSAGRSEFVSGLTGAGSALSKVFA